MNQPTLQSSGEPIGSGQERVCCVHPEGDSKQIKRQKGESDRQTRRELAMCAWLGRGGMRNLEHIPHFCGVVATNLGSGFVVDCIRDHNVEILRSQ